MENGLTDTSRIGAQFTTEYVLIQPSKLRLVQALFKIICSFESSFLVLPKPARILIPRGTLSSPSHDRQLVSVYFVARVLHLRHRLHRQEFERKWFAQRQQNEFYSGVTI